MTVISKRYCNDCHHTPVSSDATRGEKVKIKFKGICSRFVSHAYVSGKTFTAHPITSTLLTTALIATSVATAALFGTGLIVPGVVLLMAAYTVMVLGTTLFIVGRKDVDANEHKEAHSLENMQKFIQKDQKVCLVLEGTCDYNGAFKTKGPKKWERKYPVIHIKVSNIQEANDAIEKVAGVAKIQVLWLAGHGNWSNIRLGDNKDNQITIDNVVLLSDALSKLEADATIVCQSCKTAKISKDHPNVPNIASRISQAAPGRPVIAPTVSVSYENLFLKGGKNPKIGMERHKLGKKGTFLDNITPNFIGKHFRNNVMRVYKDGVLQDVASSFKVDPGS
jgi:hypothetical protein